MGCGYMTSGFPYFDWMKCFNQDAVVVMEMGVCPESGWDPHHVT